MTYTIELKDAVKGYTYDQDKIISPEETVDRFKKKAADAGLDILNRTRRIDNGRLDIPVFFSECGTHARQVIGTSKQMGKGGTPAQAEASAVMELAERFSFFSFVKTPTHFFEARPKDLGDTALAFDQIIRSVHDIEKDALKVKPIFDDLTLQWTRGYDLTLGNDESINGETSHTDGGEIFFHSNRAENLGYQQGLPPENGGFDLDIYMATTNGYYPFDIVHLDEPINSVYLDGEHFVTRDGQTMYISSNRPGTLGSLDIWISHRTGDAWSEPENLGEPVNSAASEIQPMLSPDGNTLYLNRDEGNPLVGPAIYRFHRQQDAWVGPEYVVGPFCGEPTMTDDGRLFFVHVKTNSTYPFLRENADIWVSHPAD